jgi:hypothetical protein
MKSKLLLIVCILFVTIVTIVTIVLISNGLPSHHPGPSPNHPGPSPNHPGPSPNHPVAELYLILEAPGFNVPELIKTQQIMDPSVAQSNFDKVIVMANAARYSDSNTGRKILTDQWDNKMVTALGLPVEKWAFVCCNSAVPAETMVNNLISNFPDIKGFLIDSEDDDSSVDAFVKTFKSKGSAYKYGIIGGLRKGVPPGVFDKFFSEVYTEVTNNIDEIFYEEGKKTTDGAMCVSASPGAVSHFWTGVMSKLGSDESIIPTVCGSGNCQESLYGNECFDERLSNITISSLLSGNTSGRKNFAIWYGTGQQFTCEPAKTCVAIDKATCSTNHKCWWSPSKKNPNTHGTGVCTSLVGDWGCAGEW